MFYRPSNVDTQEACPGFMVLEEDIAEEDIEEEGKTLLVD